MLSLVCKKQGSERDEEETDEKENKLEEWSHA
jgi:hypothetical protein